MKILVLNGSPKKKSDTMHITNAFLAGFTENTNDEVEIIHVIQKNIKPCLGCFTCWKTKDEIRCVHKDDMAEILEKERNADMLIWSFPLYCYGMPSHLKAVLDRHLPMQSLAMEIQGDKVVHVAHEEKRKLRPGFLRQPLMISGAGFPAFEGNFLPVIRQFKNMFGEGAPTICVPESPLFNVNEPQVESLTVPFLQKVREAGKEYRATGKLSDETIQTLGTPMIPNEIYVGITNQVDQSFCASPETRK